MVELDKHITVVNEHIQVHDDESEEKFIVSAILSQLRDYKDSRVGLEEMWLESWASYLGTPYSMEYVRHQMLRTVGNVETDWRHRINVGKAHGVVEDIHAHLMNATFPNRDWFTIEPREPSVRQMARVIRKYYAAKMDEWKFQSHFSNFLRQLIICGSSCLALPWSNRDRIEFETLDIFDVFVDAESTDFDHSPVIRRLILSRAEVMKRVRSGEYENISEWDVCHIGHQPDDVIWDDNSGKVREFQGMQTLQEYSMRDKISVYEYWGDITAQGVTYHNRVATLVGGRLVKFEENNYDCGVPLVYTTYIPIVRQPHGMSAIQASLGLLHELNLVTNQRLDNLEIAINNMYTVKAGSPTRAEDVKSKPGAVYEVTDHDDIRPIEHDTSNLIVSYQEANVLKANVDENSGTGPLVGVGQPRGGERVTATEITAVQDAGGNRLTNVYNHIEMDGLIPVLSKVLLNIRQFVRKDEIVRIAQAGGRGYDYYQVGAQELRGFKYALVPRSANYVVTQQAYIEKRTAFIQLVMSVPQFAERVDFDRILVDLMENWGFEEPEAYLIQQETPEQISSAPQSFLDRLQRMGGNPMAQAATESVSVDGGRQLFQNLSGGQQLPEGMTINDIAASYDSARSTLESI